MRLARFSYSLRYEFRLRFREGVLRGQVAERAVVLVRSFCDRCCDDLELEDVEVEGDVLLLRVRVMPWVDLVKVYNKLRSYLSKHLRTVYFVDRVIPWDFWAAGHRVRTLEG